MDWALLSYMSGLDVDCFYFSSDKNELKCMALQVSMMFFLNVFLGVASTWLVCSPLD